MRSVVLWTLAALAGILIAAGITLAASSLSSQHVGLSAEPLTAGERLVPAERRSATPSPEPSKTPQRRKRRPKRTPTPTATAVPTVQSEPGDDHGGRGRGGDDGGGSSGKGGGGGDDD